MSPARLRTLIGTELRFHFTRPLFWILLLVLGVVSWGLTSGNVTISSGDSTIGGQAKAWITSEFSIAMMLPLVTFLLYSFFVAVAAGMVVPRDDELQVGPLLHATKLSPGEYIWGKFTAVLGLFLSILLIHLLLAIFFNQVMPNPQAELLRGPFELANYLRPTVILALPFLIFLCGASFAIGELTRRPILIFFTPLAFFLISIFFLWSWSPSWLEPWLNRLLMALEPSGFRWLNETWLKVDLGVEYYNHQAITYDLPFLVSRLAYAALGIFLVFVAQWHFTATLRGSKGDTARRWGRRRPAVVAAKNTPSIAHDLTRQSLGALGMTSRPVGFSRTVGNVALFEARNLRGQPGLYLFAPLILLQTIGSKFFALGAFDTPLLLTSGIAAVGTMNTLTLLVAFLILFYTVESINREWQVGLAPIFYATPTATSAVLLGKALANSLVGATILLATYAGAALVMLLQGRVAPDPRPFLLVWGLLLVPTFLVWSSFVTAIFAITRNRYTTYGLGLAAMAYTGIKQAEGDMNWVGNWTLWDAATWTDFGSLDPNVWPLFLNRLFWLAVMGFLVVLTVRVFPRRDHDPSRLGDRLSPRGLLRSAWRPGLAALPAIVLGVVLWAQVEDGFQGGEAERRDEEYRARNLLTWNQAEQMPRLKAVDIDLDLDPDQRAFSVKGHYDLINPSDRPMHRFPMSVGNHFEDLQWTVDGEPFEPRNWARMYVFELPEPLAPGQRLRVGFSHHGRFPAGITENGGGMGEFILPSGVVLTIFGTSFLPLPAFEPQRGVDKDNRLEPRVYAKGFYEGVTPPAFGLGARYPVRTRISGPDRMQYHGVGRLESEEVVGGRRTVVWESDYPVNFFNVVAGEWKAWEGDGVAIYHHPEHDYNLDEMGEALEAARKYYSEWFYPYPWQELRVNEFPGLASYAQGFPTNITFSESIGFLTRSTPEAQVAFMVVAHETAHQWWGNILLPGEGPGGVILAEGMAHFSTILLIEQVKGLGERIEFCKRIEELYGSRRRVDAEKSLAWTDGSQPSDTTVIYDKGGWVAWMLLDLMGREAALAGIHDFIGRYIDNVDHPVLQDFVAVMREHAPDQEAYDAFIEQWYFEVVVPQYRFEKVEMTETAGRHEVSATVKNVGNGRTPIEIAAVRGVRFPEDDDKEAAPYREARVTITLREGESQTVLLPCDFEPEKVLVDPDAVVLMLKRDQAVHELGS